MILEYLMLALSRVESRKLATAYNLEKVGSALVRLEDVLPCW